jgi:hypothetical protein
MENNKFFFMSKAQYQTKDCYHCQRGMNQSIIP